MTLPVDNFNQRQNGWVDIVTVVTIWAYSIGVTIVIAIVYFCLNRIKWLDDLGRKDRSRQDPKVENIIAAVSRLAIEHESDEHGKGHYTLVARSQDDDDDE